MGQEESSISNGPPVTLPSKDLDGVAEYINSGRAKRIVVLTGAGISTAAGIPDFRSPGTGLYDNLSRLDLPYAEAVFDISYFREHPEPFYILARELYPGKFHPTVSHAFIALLAQKNLLDTLFTQNIDCLERRAGVPGDKVVEAHGSFATQRCIECKKEFDGDKMVEHVERGDVPRCEDKECKGLVKPDIVFFGEMLPKHFDRETYRLGMADLVLIIGTSLSVYPFAALPGMVQEGKPRVLFNLQRVGGIGAKSDDVLALGDCDAQVRKFADALGWRDELEKLWKSVVGEREVKRQLAQREDHEEELEDEVAKLTADVDNVLHLDGEKKEEDTEQKKHEETLRTEEEEIAAASEETPETPTQTKPESPSQTLDGDGLRMRSTGQYGRDAARAHTPTEADLVKDDSKGNDEEPKDKPAL
ncbi:uncharacterized protein J7T54_005186 [Emericellopsis cladophorae]|uniref:NAD-dependent protein deacetylase n=1 Tax=Emericellopsis cladophorae TaxID=2686198 RepID=A0A9P9Y262_9HYPO|nr:uncharacterized protein J7T54_005186 [Emericellopsis cladophorae]KAI6781975.1 hypothetical protein J7T54_005186 [Emericellopsis cladophorae]